MHIARQSSSLFVIVTQSVKMKDQKKIHLKKMMRNTVRFEAHLICNYLSKQMPYIFGYIATGHRREDSKVNKICSPKIT